MSETPAKKSTTRAKAKSEGKVEEQSAPDEATEQPSSVVEGATSAPTPDPEPGPWQRYGNSKRPPGTERDQHGNIGVAPEFSRPRQTGV